MKHEQAVNEARIKAMIAAQEVTPAAEEAEAPAPAAEEAAAPAEETPAAEGSTEA
jgi:hypothetical protein